MNLFLDTSALVKLYHEEDGSERLADFLKRNEDDLVITIQRLLKVESDYFKIFNPLNQKK